MTEGSDPEAAAVEAVVQDHFRGIHEGDVARLAPGSRAAARAWP